MRHVLLVALCACIPLTAWADEAAPERPTVHASRFGSGAGPTVAPEAMRLLDADGTKRQSNAVAFDAPDKGARESATLRCKLRVLEGGDGGAFVFLNTAEYGARGPAPFVKSWVEPNLKQTFAVGIDVHNPPSREQFSPWGNYQNLPQREISLHWDGREIVKRVAPEEFRGGFADVEITLRHVVGGAEATVKIGTGTVYDRYFIAHAVPYEMRLAIGAGTRADASTEFDIKEPAFELGGPIAKPRPPLHVEVFNHVLTNNKKTAYTAEVQLPPAGWAFGRVILTLDIHDAGKDWDEWDRNGEISIFDDAGRKLGIVPFITSYRTECHWKVDVTHFRPLLAGKRKIEIAAGTTFYKNRGYMMSVSLDFHHGTPELEPYRVVPLWVGRAKYKSAENHLQDFFAPRSVAIDGAAKAGRIFTTTTGHSQIGEFTPSKRTIVFAPVKGGDAAAEQRYENVLWKTDVYLNPNRPQFGTWQYARAGWAPGDVVWPWWIDVTPHLQCGQEAELRYLPEPYDFTGQRRQPTPKQINEANHVVRSYLILYRSADALVAAPVLLITNVAKDSNAAKAGMKAGDYLASYDGKTLNSVDDLRAAIQGAAGAGKDEIEAIVYRGAKRIETTLAPGRMGINLASR